jgi:hypothetical protein
VNDAARRTYRRFARFFLILGGVFLVLGVLRASLLPDVLRGNPVPVALLLLAIGGTLRWTVRVRPGEEEADDDEDVRRDAPADVPLPGRDEPDGRP